MAQRTARTVIVKTPFTKESVSTNNNHRGNNYGELGGTHIFKTFKSFEPIQQNDEETKN